MEFKETDRTTVQFLSEDAALINLLMTSLNTLHKEALIANSEYEVIRDKINKIREKKRIFITQPFKYFEPMAKDLYNLMKNRIYIFSKTLAKLNSEANNDNN